MNFVFITDLDGTLLGHQDFGFDQIKSDVIGLLDAGHLLVLASSKTKAEIESFCDVLGHKVPFIYENGAGMENYHLFCECEEGAHLHQNPKAIRTDALLKIWEQHIPSALRAFCHFVKDADKVAQQACLGLRATALNRALKRSYSLPFTFSGSTSQIQELECLATQAGLSMQQGGRVYNLSGCHNKADYLPEIRKWVTKTRATPVLIALGDSKNDVEMLKQADVSCVIPSNNGCCLSLGNGINPSIIAPRAAPLGWLDGLWKPCLFLLLKKE